MRLPRRVEPEALDHLPTTDSRAIRARQDLRRINRVMGTLSILCRGIDIAMRGSPPRRIVELGAGDGTLLLRLALRRAPQWPGVEVTAVDRQNVIAPETRRSFATMGWTLRVIVRDVFEWLDEVDVVPQDLLFANLFLHHFNADPLAQMLSRIAGLGTAFVACEPRRAPIALIGSHLVGLLGCNAVSRSDAVLSVHAGFRGAELTAVWPKTRSWHIDEQPAGLFTHRFVAYRSGE